VLLAVSAILLGGAIIQCPAVSAHQLAPEPAVEMYLQPQNDRLLVLLRVPTTALAEANLPRLTNGTLDFRVVTNRLRVIAAEIADSLEIKQGDITLERPTARATISALADRSFATFAQAMNRVSASQFETGGAPESDVFLDFELAYRASSSGPFSVRVNPFRVQGVPVRTIARYVAASGERIMNLRGSVQRVTFEPGRLDVTKQFVVRGLQSLVINWDSLLLLSCLVVPLRSRRTIAGLVAAIGAAEIAGAVLGTIARPGAQTLATLQVVAASGIVVASIQNIAGARLELVRALALGFGVAYGVSLGNDFVEVTAFAGGHVALAAVVFVSVVVFGQAWTGTVLSLIRRWLNERRVQERILTIGLSGLIAHSAIHRMLERSQAAGSEFEYLITQVTIGWVVVILAVAAIEVVRTRARLAHISPTRADA
jgi:hypothetical protein